MTPSPTPTDRRAVPDARRRLGPGERRDQLVAAGLSLAKSGPVSAVTAAEVAAAAGVSKGLVFHYFPSQRELHAAIAQAAADELLALLRATDAGLPYGEQLRVGLETYITYIEQEPSSYASFTRGAGSDELINAVFESTRAAVIDTIAGVIGVDDPGPRARLLLRGWVAMGEEMILEWLRTRTISRDELVGMLIDAAFEFLSWAAAPVAAGPDAER